LKISELTRKFPIDNMLVDVTVGDTVWWFAGAQLNNLPAVATILSFCEDNMINLSYNSTVGSRLVTELGVCLIGDDRLKNVHNRKRGAWCPRGTWTALELG
jgi:hypothetical protein